MKTKIRKGAFDCNSSSMHSLVIKKENAYYTKEEALKGIYLDSDGLLDARKRDMEFGRSPFKVLTTLYEKSLYTLASMCRFKGDEVYNEVCDAIRLYIPEFLDFDMEDYADTLSKRYYDKEYIKRYFCEGNFVETEDSYVVWGHKTGWVDEDILTGFLKKENITITEFLTNKRYIVVVDGDEYCIYESMKESGLIDLDAIEREFPGRNDVVY